MSDFSKTDDVIDSSDVIARIEELEADRDAYGEETGGVEQWHEGNPDDSAELQTLQALAKQGEDYAPDWQHGATLIHESYFTDYCEEMVKDIGDMRRDLPSYLVIDWEATAKNLIVDYTEIDFDGQTYLIR